MPIMKYLRPSWAVTVILAMTLIFGTAIAATVVHAGEVTISAASDPNFAIK